MRRHIISIISLTCCAMAFCQESESVQQLVKEMDPNRQWSLKDVVEYAISNSVQVKTQEVDVENKGINLQTSQFSRLPSLSASIGEDLNFGRSQNREGVTEDQSSYNTNIGAYASIPVFGGFKINQQIKADKYGLEASKLDLEQSKQDLSLDVVACFLQVLYSHEALNIAREQVEINKKLVKNTDGLVKGGKKTISELYNAQSSLANSESDLVEAENGCKTAMLDLVQAINYPDPRGFRLVMDEADMALGEALLSLTPADSIYDSYLSRRPSILASENKVKMAMKQVKVAQSQYWPTISLGVSYGTGYYGTSQASTKPSFFEQLGYNGQVVIGATMSIPIFNRMASYNSVRTAKNNVRLKQLSLQQDRIDAMKDVQTAYVNASTALGKYEASKKSVDAAKKAFEYEEKKFEAGRSTAYQFDEMRQKYAKATLNQLQAKYNFIFRTKILDFYKGNPLY